MRIEPASDDELIDALNRGDASAFAPLYHRYRDFVARLALRFTRDHHDALDVVQETFAYFFAKFPGFTRTAALTSFLYPVVKHIAIHLLKKRRRVTGDADLEQLTAPLIPSDDRADLADALRALPEPLREALLMRFVDGMSIAEIAAALAIPAGTVKSRLHNAIHALRQSPTARRYFGQDFP